MPRNTIALTLLILCLSIIALGLLIEPLLP